MPIIICFEGHLAADPSSARTPHTDTPVCEAVVMVNRRTKRDGDWADATPTRYAIKAWKKHAEALATCTTGTGVVVIGHVETESWEDQDGRRRYTDTVVVDSLGQTMPTR